MSAPSPLPATSSITHSSNLLQYRALFQVFTYARLHKQSAEHVVRDAMTGGVVVPFLVTATAAEERKHMSDNVTSGVSQFGSSQSSDHVTPLLLLPSSKAISTLAMLLADGFFNIAPLSSTAEKVAGTPFQIRSECEPRDYFTLIALLFPDCVVEEAVPRQLLAMRRAEAANALAASHSRSVSGQVSPAATRALSPSLALSTTSADGGRLRHSPPPALSSSSAVEADRGEASAVTHTTSLVTIQDVSLAESRTTLPTILPGTSLLERPSMADLALESPAVAKSLAAAAARLSSPVLPEVDAVPLSMDSLDALLSCRRSLATVLLSSLNELLHDVQYRELERAKPSVAGSAMRGSEAAALQVTSELLLAAKLMLTSLLTASELWLRRVQQRAALKEGSSSHTASLPLSPYCALHTIYEADPSTATQFTSVPVEQWTWGRDKGAMARWYDSTLDHLLQSAESEGLRLDPFMQRAKTAAVTAGRAVSRAPTLLLHRASDGRPSTTLTVTAATTALSDAIALPKLPLQPGEAQLLLYPCSGAASGSTGGAVSRGHDMLFDDSGASPLMEFLQTCVSTACSPAMLQPTGSEVPLVFRQPFHALPKSERRALAAALADPAQLGGFLEKNAAMLARLITWCEGAWPPVQQRGGAKQDCVTDPRAIFSTSTLSEEENMNDEVPLALEVKEAILFRRPFSAAVGRYVRETILLNGFDQVTLERWIRHLCERLASDAAFSSHKTILAALVKFATLHSRWTLTSDVAELQRQYLP